MLAESTITRGMIFHLMGVAKCLNKGLTIAVKRKVNNGHYIKLDTNFATTSTASIPKINRGIATTPTRISYSGDGIFKGLRGGLGRGFT